MAIKAPRLPYDELRRIAAKFLADHHPLQAVPIPIVRIAEFCYEMDIVPVPGLQTAFDTDSSISSDLTTIYVDEFVFRSRHSRYRFSVAHELSHRLLHADILAELRFSSIAEFKTAIASIPPDQYRWIEWQAYSLAGLILVPKDALAVAYSKANGAAEAAGICLRNVDTHAANIICANIAKDFLVSTTVIRKRLKFDDVIDWESMSR